jgi:multidrug resistance efflux pump
MAEKETMLEKVEEMENVPAKSRVPLMVAAGLVLVVGGGIAALAYILVGNQRVYIETSSVMSPSIPLAPVSAGTLEQVYVSVGDVIPANTVVAEVGTQLVTSTIGGLVISTDTTIGSQITSGMPVVTMIDPMQLRVDLKKIKVLLMWQWGSVQHSLSMHFQGKHTMVS